jgi:hypothetical protein
VDLPERQPGNGFVSRLWATQRVGFLSAERRRNGANPELDQEIRSLGERYSIPTMFTSYMVIEPGVVIGPDGRVTNAADFAARVAPEGAQARGAAGRAGGGGGGGRAAFAISPSRAANQAASPATAHEAVARDEIFRRTRSEADMDKALADGKSKRVGDRVFALVDSIWIDVRHRDSITVTKIKPYSEVYFELLKSIPSLNPVFALGDKVLVSGKTAAILLDESGSEKLTRAQLDAFVKNW